MKKGLLAAACLLALVLMMSACSGSAPSSQPTPAQPESVAPVPQAASVAQEEASNPKTAPQAAPATPDTLDEEVAVTAYCLAFGEDPGQYTPEYREQIELVFSPEGDYWGVFTGNRGGATYVAVDDTSATVVDTGTMGDITFVKIIDLALEEVVFDFYDLNPSTGDANGYTLDNEDAALAYALAYGYEPMTVEEMKAIDFTFTQDSDNQITLHGNRGGGWTIVRVDYVDTVVDFGSMGDPFIVSVVDNINGELVFQTPTEN